METSTPKSKDVTLFYCAADEERFDDLFNDDYIRDQAFQYTDLPDPTPKQCAHVRRLAKEKMLELKKADKKNYHIWTDGYRVFVGNHKDSLAFAFNKKRESISAGTYPRDWANIPFDDVSPALLFAEHQVFVPTDTVPFSRLEQRDASVKLYWKRREAYYRKVKEQTDAIERKQRAEERQKRWSRRPLQAKWAFNKKRPQPLPYITKRGLPTEPGWYMQWWCPDSKYVRQVFEKGGELCVWSFNDPKEPKEFKLTEFCKTSYWERMDDV